MRTSAAAAFVFSTAVIAATTSYDLASIDSVLATGLPPSLISEALTNTKALASDIVSEFADFQTPSWFAALPTPVQSFLLDSNNIANPSEPGKTASPKTRIPSSNSMQQQSSEQGSSTTEHGSAASGTGKSSSSAQDSTHTSSGLGVAPTAALLSGAFVGAAGIIGALVL